MSEKVDLKKSVERENRVDPARSEDGEEFVNGCFYAPWDI